MEFKKNNEIMTVVLDERIDSVNAPQVEAEIFAELTDDVKDVQIDAEKLEYISSTGLRVFLKLRKAQGHPLTVFNVSREVYEIFEMTGFTDLLDVRKALRKISVDGCEFIGSGGYGKVYRLDAETIIKVYNEGISSEFIDGERAASKKAFVLGVPTAIPYDTVKVGNCFGVIYERLDAKTVAQLIDQDNTRLPALGALCANALKGFHQIRPEEGDFPLHKDKFFAWIERISNYITAEEKQKMVDYLNSIPDRKTFLHGDYNSKNIMIMDGQVVLIDIGDASIGHPVFDLAGLMVAYLALPKSEKGPAVARQLMGFDLELAGDMWGVMCSTYFGTQDPQEIRKITEMLMPLMNLIIAFRGFNMGELAEDIVPVMIDRLVRGLFLKSLENAVPISF